MGNEHSELQLIQTSRYSCEININSRSTGIRQQNITRRLCNFAVIFYIEYHNM